MEKKNTKHSDDNKDALTHEERYIDLYNLFMLTLTIPWWIWLIIKCMSPSSNQFIISSSVSLKSLTSLQSSDCVWYHKLDEMVSSGCQIPLNLDKHEFLSQY